MKTSMFFLLCFLFFSCNKKEKIILKSNKEVIDIEAKKDSITTLFDTLVFSENMNGKLLNDKYDSSKPKLSFYKKFINQNSVNKLKTITDEHTKTEIVYLGILNDLNEKDSYHVITNFKVIGIGEMLSPRGISEVAFINTKDNKIITYDMAMPYYLPVKIENNSLYFEFENKKIFVAVLDGFAPYLCIPKIGCY
jgi:hypothetical protein